MQRSTNILLYSLVVSLAVLDRGVAQNKQSIAAAEFLSVLAKNVANVLSSTLVEELQDGRPNRTAVNATNVQTISTTSEIPNVSETTKVPLKSLNLEADTVRSAQTQSEVGLGNQGFPFNYDDNYRYNYQGINTEGLQRPEFTSGSPFGQSGYYNSEPYRSYPLQTIPDRSSRPEENILQRGEQAAGISAVESIGNGQSGPLRTIDSLDPSSANFDRFRNLERFPFNNQFSSGLGNFQNSPFLPERHHDGRFNDERFNDGRFSSYNTNSPGNPNLPGNPNFQNSIGNNYPRNNLQSLVNPFQQRQQAHGSNSFDFIPSQRFQNPFDNYPRSLQRGPNFPGFYFPPYVPRLRDVGNSATSTPKVDVNNTEQTSSSELSAKAEKLNINSVKNSSETTVATENPQVLSIEGRLRFGNLFLPALEDYSDLRFQPDAFRQYFYIPTKKNNNYYKNVSNNNKNNNQNNINNNKNNNTNNVINNNNNNNSTNDNFNSI